MKILHTSDLHIGHVLHFQDRRDETDAMLDWLAGTLKREGAEALILAGDIFDRSQAGNASQKVYYDFFRRVRDAGCRHIVVVAGNHDSPSLIDAPQAVLENLVESLCVTVVGSVPLRVSDDEDAGRRDLSREVRVLRDANGRPELIVCAVPYLREADVRLSDEEAESFLGDAAVEFGRHRLFQEGVKRHYRAVTDIALERRKELASEVGEEAAQNIPIVATGHLTVLGCSLGGGEEAGERRGADDDAPVVYVGNVQSVDAASVFPEELDYVALGHIHRPQPVGHQDHWRYSGSPLKLDFGEGDKKSVVLVEFDDAGSRTIRTVEVPAFRRLVQVSGSWKEISAKLRELKIEAEGEKLPVWCSVTLTEGEPNLRIREDAAALTKDSGVQVLHAKNAAEGAASVSGEAPGADISLREMTPMGVFKKLLTDKGYAPDLEVWAELLATFQEALTALGDEDANAGK